MRRPALFAVVALIAVTLLDALGALKAVDLRVRDAAMRLLPRRAAAATAVVAIDESSLKRVGHWPWRRATLAALMNRIAAGGAKGIVIDILLAEAQPGDEQIAAATKRIPTVMIAALADNRREWLLPALELRGNAAIAHGNFELDGDGIVRRLAATKQPGRQPLTAACFEAASIVNNIAVPVGRAFAPAYRTPPGAIPIVSAADVLQAPVNLEGKLVFVGPTAMGLGDRVLTPVSSLPDPGVTVHAAATESLLRGEEIRDLPPIGAGLIAAVAVALIVHGRASRARTFLASAALAIAILGGGLLLLARSGEAIPFVALLLTIGITAAGVESAALTTTLGLRRAEAARMAEWREREAETKRLLAHELKTPLASMRGLTQLLAGFELTDAERRRVTALLESEAGKLQSMVHGLLDLERIPLRDFATSASVIDLGALAAARVDFLSASTDRELVADCAGGVYVRGDATLIERIIDNLVGNALKYTAAPAPVFVRVSKDAALEVEDRGTGIGDAERERIFQRFFRGASAAGTQGLGLGLSFVAEIARWHGGRVDVERAPAGGSIFRVTFPPAATYARVGAM